MQFITVLSSNGTYAKDINLAYLKSFYQIHDKTILDMGDDGYYYSTMSLDELRKLTEGK